MSSAFLTYVYPSLAVAGSAGALARWYIVDRRKSRIETRLAEDNAESDIDLNDTGARDARLVYVQRQVDMERAFHVQQISDRDAEIARQRVELIHRDEIIASLLRQVDRLEVQLAQVGRDLMAVRTQLADMKEGGSPPPTRRDTP